MTIRARGRAALILTAGFLVCLAGPSQAAAGADDTAKPAAAKPSVAVRHARHGTHHLKRYAHYRPGKLALKSSADVKPEATDDGDQPAVLPPSVANANAQLAQADPSAGNAAQAMAARANDLVQAAQDKPADAQPAADTQTNWPDPLKGSDRAQRDSAPASAPVALAATEQPQAAPAPPVAAASHESSTWDETSLIGRIFIGFGALLTMASAARMFMA
jgi:hypothetical protein